MPVSKEFRDIYAIFSIFDSGESAIAFINCMKKLKGSMTKEENHAFMLQLVSDLKHQHLELSKYRALKPDPSSKHQKIEDFMFHNYITDNTH